MVASQLTNGCTPWELADCINEHTYNPKVSAISLLTLSLRNFNRCANCGQRCKKALCSQFLVYDHLALNLNLLLFSRRSVRRTIYTENRSSEDSSPQFCNRPPPPRFKYYRAEFSPRSGALTECSWHQRSPGCYFSYCNFTLNTSITFSVLPVSLCKDPRTRS